MPRASQRLKLYTGGFAVLTALLTACGEAPDVVMSGSSTESRTSEASAGPSAEPTSTGLDCSPPGGLILNATMHVAENATGGAAGPDEAVARELERSFPGIRPSEAKPSSSAGAGSGRFDVHRDNRRQLVLYTSKVGGGYWVTEYSLCHSFKAEARGEK